MGSQCFMGTEFQFCKMNEFWRQTVVMIVHHHHM